MRFTQDMGDRFTHDSSKRVTWSLMRYATYFMTVVERVLNLASENILFRVRILGVTCGSDCSTGSRSSSLSQKNCRRICLGRGPCLRISSL